jgi:hypothetical protein
MATWGEFIAEMPVQKSPKGGMVVPVDDVITLFDERNKLRQEVARLQAELAAEREGCAQDIDDFAEACAAEPEQPEYLVPVLRAAANLIRQRGEPEAEEMDEAEVQEPAAAAEAVAPEEAPQLAAPVEEAPPLAAPVEEEHGTPGA